MWHGCHNYNLRVKRSPTLNLLLLWKMVFTQIYRIRARIFWKLVRSSSVFNETAFYRSGKSFCGKKCLRKTFFHFFVSLRGLLSDFLTKSFCRFFYLLKFMLIVLKEFLRGFFFPKNFIFLQFLLHFHRELFMKWPPKLFTCLELFFEEKVFSNKYICFLKIVLTTGNKGQLLAKLFLARVSNWPLTCSKVSL